MGLPKIKGPGTVRTGLDTGPATDAPVIVNRYYTVIPLVGRVYGTNRNAGRIIALQAGPGKKVSCYLRVGSHFLLKNRTVNHSRGQMVFRHTSHRACMTSHAFFQIDHHDPVSFFLTILHGLLNFFLHSQEAVLFEFRKIGKGGGRFR
jgi:hypothetical protein